MRTIEWQIQPGRLQLIDQRQLPWNVHPLEFDDYRAVAQYISDGGAHGEASIGVLAAYAMALAAKQSPALDMGGLLEFLEVASVILKKGHPAIIQPVVEQMMTVAKDDIYANVKEIKSALIHEADRIANENITLHRTLAKHGSSLIRSDTTILLHVNSEPMAAVEYGGAIAIIRNAQENGKRIRVLVPEGRPQMYGARLAAWQLTQIGVPFEIIPDSAAGHLVRKGEVDMLLAESDRIAGNGDTISRVGAYPLAVVARDNNKPFYVVTTIHGIDLALASGDQAEIEHRPAEEMHTPYDRALIPDSYPVRAPAADVTPQRYLAGIITERGIIAPPFRENLPKVINPTMQPA